MLTNLFFSQDTAEYYWTGRNTCDKCLKHIELKGLLVWDYWLTTLKENIYCYNCKEQILKVIGRCAEIKTITLGIVELLPEDITPIRPVRVQLGNTTGLNVYEMAVKSSEGRTIDRTVHSTEVLKLDSEKAKLQLTQRGEE